MTQTRSSFMLLTLGALGVWACGGETPAGTGDQPGGERPPAQLELCAASSASCHHQDQCAPVQSMTDCHASACLPYGNAVCVAGACEQQARLGVGVYYTLSVSLRDLPEKPQSLLGFAVAAKTSGGREMTCEDVYRLPHHWGPMHPEQRACFNVLRTIDFRYQQTTDGEVIPLKYSLFPSGQKTLFVAYAYGKPLSDTNPGQPIGVACRAYDVPQGAGSPGEIQLPDNNDSNMHPIR